MQRFSIASTIVCCALLSGCSVVTDPGADEFRPTLDLDVSPVMAEPDGRFGFYILDHANDAVHTGYIVGLPAEGFATYIPYVLGDDDYAVALWADLDGDRSPSDGEPRFFPSVEDLDTDDFATKVADVDFREPGTFDLPVNQLGMLGFRWVLMEFGANHPDQLLELRVIDITDDSRPMPLLTYRVDRIPPDGELELFVPEVIQAGHRYRVEFYADRDLSGFYSGTASDADHSWARELDAGPTGIDEEFPHSMPFDELDYFVIVD